MGNACSGSSTAGASKPAPPPAKVASKDAAVISKGGLPGASAQNGAHNTQPPNMPVKDKPVSTGQANDALQVPLSGPSLV